LKREAPELYIRGTDDSEKGKVRTLLVASPRLGGGGRRFGEFTVLKLHPRSVCGGRETEKLRKN